MAFRLQDIIFFFPSLFSLIILNCLKKSDIAAFFNISSKTQSQALISNLVAKEQLIIVFVTFLTHFVSLKTSENLWFFVYSWGVERYQ